MFDIEEYDYELPEGLIAQEPASQRDSSRLLLVDRLKRTLSEHHFFDLPSLLKPGDLLVVNNTKVVPARLFGRKESGGKIEVLVLNLPRAAGGGGNSRWCLVRSSKKPRRGGLLFFDSGISGRVLDISDEGLVLIGFEGKASVPLLLEKEGRMPLPPYIRRKKGDHRRRLDRERYQTIFSKVSGAVAAPTAGLHFTEGLVSELEKRGIRVASVTLHVGHGTFRPVRSKDIRRHRLGEEAYRIEDRTVAAVRACKRAGGRVIACGTTVVRTLETAARPGGRIRAGQGITGLLIVPGFSFRVVEGLITNFHLPKSSLLFLVSAFAGPDLVRRAYQFAIHKRYRFYSYGDAMLIL